MIVNDERIAYYSSLLSGGYGIFNCKSINQLGYTFRRDDCWGIVKCGSEGRLKNALNFKIVVLVETFLKRTKLRRLMRGKYDR